MRQSLKILMLLLAGIGAMFKRAWRGPVSPDRKVSEDESHADSKHRFWHTAKVLLIAAVVLGAIGVLVLVSGVVPITASSGHWPVTRWVLTFAKQRSVATHSLTIEAPPLSDPMLVQKGAGAYESNCRVCHGSPELPHPAVAQQMLPRPPYLPEAVSKWETKELFYIVKHGLKFTGMPAWPSQQRDDEVWAVVAFLREFPKLDQNSYRALVGVEHTSEAEDSFARLVRHCESCHGPEGAGHRLGPAPRLAGQKVDYLYFSISAYARRERFSGIMQPIASRLGDEEKHRLAQHYARRSAPVQTVADAESFSRGESIANRGIPEKRVPACNSCHGQAGPRNPIYPKLSGQYANYIVTQLKLFQQDHRGGTSYAHLMRHVAPQLSEEQIRDVALYYESLTPEPRD
jgi:cytochrome c553